MSVTKRRHPNNKVKQIYIKDKILYLILWSLVLLLFIYFYYFFRRHGGGSSSFLKVLSSDKVFNVVQQIHNQELKHSSYKKVMDVIHRQYYGITTTYVQEYCSACPVCQLSQPQSTRAPLKPIIKSEFLYRLQMDFIDLRNSPDGQYHYIAHVMDHFSKFHILFPTKTKEVDEVAT